MKQTDIKAGKTYRGRDGAERKVNYIGEAPHVYPDGRAERRMFLSYSGSEWWNDCVLLRTFARWAVEEVKP